MLQNFMKYKGNNMKILIVQYNTSFTTPFEFDYNLVIYDSICTEFGRLSMVNY